MYCGNCGNQLNDIAIYCNKCGARIPDHPKDNAPSEPKKRTLKEEYRTGILLWVIPILYFVLTTFVFHPWINHINHLIRQGVEEGFNLLERYSYVVWSSNAVMQGTLAYTATKRSFRFTMLASLPYVIQIVAEPFLVMWLAINMYYDFPFNSLHGNVGYFGPILCLIILWITVFFTRKTLQKKKIHPLIQITVFTLFAVFLFLARTILYNWSIFYEYEFLQDFRIEDQIENPLVLTILITALATSAALYFLHRKHDQQK